MDFHLQLHILEFLGVALRIENENMNLFCNTLLNCTLKIRFFESNFWGVFFVIKLINENNIQIYKLRKQGYSYVQFSNRYVVKLFNLIYMIDQYGIKIVKKGKNHNYFSELKQEIIDKVLLDGYLQLSVSLDFALP